MLLVQGVSNASCDREARDEYEYTRIKASVVSVPRLNHMRYVLPALRAHLSKDNVYIYIYIYTRRCIQVNETHVIQAVSLVAAAESHPHSLL